MNRTAKMLRSVVPWAEPRSMKFAKLHFAANQAVRSFGGKYTKLTSIQQTMMERLEEAVKEG